MGGFIACAPFNPKRRVSFSCHHSLIDKSVENRYCLSDFFNIYKFHCSLENSSNLSAAAQDCPQVTVTAESQPVEEQSQNTSDDLLQPDEFHDTLDIEPCSYDGFRRLSATLEEMEEQANDSR